MITLFSGTAFADDPIKITISGAFDDVIFDGGVVIWARMEGIFFG